VGNLRQRTWSEASQSYWNCQWYFFICGYLKSCLWDPCGNKGIC